MRATICLVPIISHVLLFHPHNNTLRCFKSHFTVEKIVAQGRKTYLSKWVSPDFNSGLAVSMELLGDNTSEFGVHIWLMSKRSD